MKGLESGLVASLDLGVAKTAGSVNVLDVARLHEASDEGLLVRGLEGDHVHAHLAAVVAAGKPVPAGVPQDGLVRGPADPIALASEVEVADCKVAEKRFFKN